MSAETDPLLSTPRKDAFKKSCCSRVCLRNFITLSVLWIAYLVVSSAYSVLGPFFPQEAAEFGVGSFIVGIIMGVSPLCVVVLSPVFGYFVPEIGLKFMLIAGLFLVGGSFVLIGFLIEMTSTVEFITFSMLLRTVEGIGTAGYFTASFTIATTLYPTKTGTVVGLLEVGSGLGFVLGPPIGGVLYNLGGFILPFAVTGGLVLLFIPLLLILIPQTKGEKKVLPPRTIAKLIIDVPFLVLCLCNMTVIASLGFFVPVLSPFLLSQFHLSEIAIGLVFLIGPLTYMLTSLFAGCFTDIIGPRYITIVGILIAAISFFFIGPAPFIINTSYFWLTCLAFAFTGIGIGCGLVPIFSDVLKIARKIDPHTSPELMSGIISGVCNASCSLGEFGGPIIGGGLSQFLSFQMSSAIFGMMLLAQALLLLGVTLIDRFISYKQHNVKTPEALN